LRGRLLAIRKKERGGTKKNVRQKWGGKGGGSSVVHLRAPKSGDRGVRGTLVGAKESQYGKGTVRGEGST